MIRSLFQQSALFGLFAISIFFIHHYILLGNKIVLPFALHHVYFFHVLFSIVLTLLFYRLDQTPKLKGQIGFFYLASVVLKAVLFFVLFSRVIFNDQTFTRIEAASLLIPLLIGLAFEVLVLSKLLKVGGSIKNE